MSERRMSTPAVLAAVSTMVGVGLAALLGLQTRADDHAPAPPTRTHAQIDTSTAERAAESFVDAWRKRDHEAAASIALGVARRMVEERRQRDAQMSADDRELKRQVWDAMARERLQLRLRESEVLEAGALALRGTVEGPFLGHDYVREVEVVVRETPSGWRILECAFGEILSDVPRVLRMED